MSYDLYFCRENHSIPTIAELKDYFSALPFFQIHDLEAGGVQFFYQNEATGVYGSFSSSPLDANELEDCASSGLAFNLNYCRPSFFAYETMPLVEAFCKRFDLLVEDPQEETVQLAKAEHLISSWRSQNESAVRMLAKVSKQEDTELHYLPEQRATEWWRYMRSKQKLEDAITEDIFVPTSMLLIAPTRELFTLVLWPEAIAQFFPPCEYVCVAREKKRLFRTEKEMGLIPYSSLMDTLRPLLDDHELDGLELKYLHPQKTSQAARAIQKINLQPFDKTKHSRFPSDNFHDVALLETQ